MSEHQPCPMALPNYIHTLLCVGHLCGSQWQIECWCGVSGPACQSASEAWAAWDAMPRHQPLPRCRDCEKLAGELEQAKQTIRMESHSATFWDRLCHSERTKVAEQKAEIAALNDELTTMGRMTNEKLREAFVAGAAWWEQRMATRKLSQLGTRRANEEAHRRWPEVSGE